LITGRSPSVVGREDIPLIHPAGTPGVVTDFKTAPVVDPKDINIQNVNYNIQNVNYNIQNVNNNIQNNFKATPEMMEFEGAIPVTRTINMHDQDMAPQPLDSNGSFDYSDGAFEHM
jgi:flagellar basal body P-ring protein FlgI